MTPEDRNELVQRSRALRSHLRELEAGLIGMTITRCSTVSILPRLDLFDHIGDLHTEISDFIRTEHI